jgi:hypothetical protein
MFEDNPNPISAHFVQNVLHGTVTYKIMDRQSFTFAKGHIKNKIIRLNFILFIYYIDLIVIFR